MRLYAKFCVTPLMVCLQIFGECRVLSSVVLIKVGGSSITQKAVKETLNVEALNWFVRTISQLEGLSFVLVHGAGSFGHHMAKEHGLRGQTEPPKIMVDSDIETKRERMRGLSRTRLSVQKLNQAIVSAFLEQGQAAVGISPCFGVPGVQAHGGGETAKTLLRETVKLSVDAGLIPILHGDACLYGKDGAGILSGDTVTEILGRASWVSHVVFLTDVDGVFTADPNKAVNAVLLRDLTVDTVSAKITSTEALNASGSSHDHDVTGGLQTKLASAASIAAAGKNVSIVRCGSVSAEQAIRALSDVDVGTVLRPAEQCSWKNKINNRMIDSPLLSIRTFAMTIQARYRKMLVDYCRSKILL